MAWMVRCCEDDGVVVLHSWSDDGDELYRGVVKYRSLSSGVM